MTDSFTYDKEDFGYFILNYLKRAFTPKDIKNIIEAEMTSASQTFRNNVFRRIIAFRVGGDWWYSNSQHCNRTKVTRELVAIWKLVTRLHKSMFADKSVEEYAHEHLAEYEKKLHDGEINEQEFIEKSNWIMRCKDSDEALVDCCSCCVVGSMNIPEDMTEYILRIVCLPCGWDVNSTPVRFVL